ncbi:MAG: response regulator [Chloroflexi bacterium]|nr:response regulator [Chloroflexota bacterium]
MTAASGARILVVDDEPGILRAVQTNLGHHDFHVDDFHVSHQALPPSHGRTRRDGGARVRFARGDCRA